MGCAPDCGVSSRAWGDTVVYLEFRIEIIVTFVISASELQNLLQIELRIASLVSVPVSDSASDLALRFQGWLYPSQGCMLEYLDSVPPIPTRGVLSFGAIGGT